MRRIVVIVMLLGLCRWALAQGGITLLEGKVLSRGRPVPYATLQLAGTSTGVACNDNGEYTFKVPEGSLADTVVVHSVGYVPRRQTVADLLKNGTVRLKEQTVTLREVQVNSFRKPQHLIARAVDSIGKVFHQRNAVSTFFYRNWRAVDGELYLFDEAVMAVRRAGYSRYADKMAYMFATDRREMKSNYKTVLKHRLVVYDRDLVAEKCGDPDAVDNRMSYADNEEFYDPISTPMASMALSHGALARHKFEPIQEFVDNGEAFYRLRSVGPGRIAKTTLHYEYIVRKSDMAIISITETVDSLNMPVPTEPWINIKYDRLVILADSSIWNYDVRDGRYTLTRYYNTQTLGLATGNRLHVEVGQRWQQCVDWRLTDFSTDADTLHGQTLAVKPQTLAGAFGASDYNGDFWGQYNSIPIDIEPAWLLYNKFEKIKSKR